MVKKTKWDWLRPDYDLTDDYGWLSPVYWLYDHINPFRERNIVKDREWVYSLVDNCMRSDFWGGRQCPLNSADVEAIRAILYDKIDKHPYLN